jgi:hypothetical protein
MIMFLIGATVVAINATTQFRKRVPSVGPKTPNRLLDGLPTHIQTGKRSHSIGFAFYLIVFEFFYLLLSTSTVLLQAFMQFTGNTGSIGALAVDQNVINPYVPIIASSIVVTLSQLKPFNEVELFLRRVSQRFSRTINIEDIANDIFKEKLPATRAKDEKPKTAAANLQKILKKQGWTASHIKDFKNILDDIEFLDAWTDGEQSNIFHTLGSVEAIARTKASEVEAPLAAFQKQLLHATGNTETDIDRYNILKRPQKPVIRAEEFWTGALGEAREIKHKLSELLALYLINTPDATQSIEDTETGKFFDRIQHPNRTEEYSIVATATMLGASVCFIIFFAYHLTINAILDLLSSWYSIVGPSNHYLQSFQEVGNLDTGDITHSINLGYYFSHLASKSATSAFWDICIYGAMFLMAATLAVAARHAGSPPKEWITWSCRDIPFWQYASVGAVASILTLLVYTMLLFVRLVVLPSLALDNTVLSVTLLADFKNYWAMSSGVPLMAFAIASGICFIHDKLSQNTRDEVAHTSIFCYPNHYRVFTGSQKKCDLKYVNIGSALLVFSLTVATINLVVMLIAGVLTSPQQIFNAVFLPSVAFIIIASTYFELLSIKREANEPYIGNANASANGMHGYDAASTMYEKTGGTKNEKNTTKT